MTRIRLVALTVVVLANAAGAFAQSTAAPVVPADNLDPVSRADARVSLRGTGSSIALAVGELDPISRAQASFGARRPGLFSVVPMSAEAALPARDYATYLQEYNKY